MTLEVVERVVNDDVLLHLFEIPPSLWPMIRKSWKERKTDMLGRMDLAWNGKDAPKLLEYNGDTPSVLVESGAAQLNWMRDMREVTGALAVNSTSSSGGDASKHIPAASD